MNFFINKKDIISLNLCIGEKGTLRSESSLEFALSSIVNKPWLFQAAYLARCLLVDHPFEDGNKRTALAVILIYFDYYETEYDKEKILKMVHTIAKKNIIDINKIMRMIKNAIT